MDLATLGIAVRSDQVVQANRELEKMPGAARRAESAAKGFGTSASGAARKVAAANDNAARSAGLVTKAYGAMRIAVVAALATMTAVLGRFVTTSISAASDLNETISKTSTIFGDQGAAMLEWASNSAQAMGLSQQAALEAASTMGNMFSQLGAGREVAGGISRDMIQLAADIASFNNVAGGAVAVSDAMQSAFRGEYDSLQRYIPTINAATVAQEALRMTGKANEKQLTALEKALAAQKLIMEGAGVAAGDFARTSGGLANQQRILAASLTDVSAKFGAAFTPLATLIVQGLNAAVSGLSAGMSILADNIDTIGVAAGTAGTLMLIAFGPTILASMAAGFVALGTAGVTAIRAITAAIAANPLGALAVGIVAAVTALYVFRDEVQKAIGVDVIGIVKNAANLIIGSFVAAFEDIKFVWSNFGNIIGGAVMGGVNVVIAGVEMMVNAAISGINKLISAVNSLPDWMKPESLENISALGDVSLGRAANPGADAMTGGGRHSALSRHNERQQAALNTDYLGSIGKSAEMSTPAVQALNAAIGVTEQTAAGAGKAMKAAADTDPWKGMRKAVDVVNEGLEFAKGLAQGIGSDISSSLQSGMSLWESFKVAGVNAIKKIADQFISSGIERMFSGLGKGSGGGFFGTLLSGIGSLFGFANGGYTGSGAASAVAGVVHGGEYVFSKAATDRIGVSNLDRAHNAAKGYANGGYVQPRMQAPANSNGGGVSNHVTIHQTYKISGAVSEKDVRAMVRKGSEESVEYVKQNLPGWSNDIQVHGVPA